MIQFAVWCALTAAGLGANLQHYNPAIDEAVPAPKPETPIGSRVIVI